MTLSLWALAKATSLWIASSAWDYISFGAPPRPVPLFLGPSTPTEPMTTLPGDQCTFRNSDFPEANHSNGRSRPGRHRHGHGSGERQYHNCECVWHDCRG